MKNYCFFYLIVLFLPVSYPASFTEVFQVLEALRNSLSSNPSEKDILNSLMEKLQKQSHNIAKNAEIQISNIILLDSLLDKITFELEKYEKHKKNFIDKSIQDIKQQYNDFYKMSQEVVQLGKTTGMVTLLKIFVRFFRVSFRKYFGLLNEYQKNFDFAHVPGFLPYEKKIIFPKDPLKELPLLESDLLLFDQNNDNKLSILYDLQNKQLNDFLTLMQNTKNLVHHLLQIEKSRDITDTKTRIFDLKDVFNTLEKFLFDKVSVQKKNIEKGYLVLVKIELLLKNSLLKIGVIRDAFIKEKNISGYKNEDFVAELVAKVGVKLEKVSDAKLKIFNNFKLQDSKFNKIVKKLQAFGTKYKNGGGKKIDLAVNDFSQIIGLLQGYTTELLVLMNECKSLTDGLSHLEQWKKELVNNFNQFTKNKKKLRKEKKEKKAAAALPPKQEEQAQVVKNKSTSEQDKKVISNNQIINSNKKKYNKKAPLKPLKKVKK
jgi:hypothetical protein